MTTKWCPGCEADVDRRCFQKCISKKDGLQEYCKTCRKKIDRRIYENRSEEKREQYRKQVKDRSDQNTERLTLYLQDHPCVDCGEPDPVVLEFDHVRGKKRGNVSSMLHHHSWSTILTEIGKCEVRCANCHRRVTAKRQNSRKHQMILPP